MQESLAPEQEGQEQAGTAVDAGGPHAGQADTPERTPESAEEHPEDLTENLDAFTVFKRAKASYFKCEYDRALGYVNYAIGLDPEQRDFYRLKASILNDSPGSSTGSVRALVAVLEKMIRLNPREIDAILQMAELYEAMKMPNKAAKYWQMARAIHPSHPKLAQKSGPGEETWPGIILREATDLGGKAKDKALDWIDRFRR